jgi:TetR/AcrR family transcriptional regulator, cholesterol catabolism regulator
MSTRKTKTSLVAQEPEAESIPDAGVKRRKSDIRREAILRAATELFDRQGYANTSLDDVSQAVGIKREALYYYYRSRAEILLAIIGPQAAALIDGMKEVVASDDPAPVKLRSAVHNHLKRFDRHCLEMTISLRDGITNAGEVGSAMSKIWKEYEQLWTSLIESGQRSGEFAALGDAKMVTFGILGMCNWLARWYNPRKPASLDEIIDTYFTLVSQGLVPRSAEAAKTMAAPAARKAPVINKSTSK